MSDGVNFPQLPLWEDMDFAADCDVWGNWMASRYLPNPWNKSETLGGTYVLGINLFAAASPVDFYTIADQANLTIPEAYSGISQWFTWHTLNTWNETEGNWDTSPEFYENVIYAPFLQCTAEYCKSLGYTGNADLTGIGVRHTLFLTFLVVLPKLGLHFTISDTRCPTPRCTSRTTSKLRSRPPT